MKKILFIQLLISTFIFSNTKEHIIPDFNWPIKNSYIGENVILSPIDQVYNKYRDLYHPNLIYEIGGDERTPVVAIADGIIKDYDYHYSDAPAYSSSFDNYEEIEEYVRNKKGGVLKWISLSIAIQTSRNEIVWYTGLHIKDKKDFKTGDKVKQGDIIGTIGFHFPLKDKPSIHIEYSKNGRLTDLLEKITGVQNPYFSDKKDMQNYKTKIHSIEVLKENLEVIYESLIDLHPNLYYFSSKRDFEVLYNEIRSNIIKPLTSDQYFKMVNPLIQIVKDNHTYLIRKYYYDKYYNYTQKSYLPLKLSVVNNKCYVIDDPINSTSPGTEILYINKEPVNDIIKNIRTLMTISSGEITTWQNEIFKRNFEYYYILYKELSLGEAIKIEFNNNDIQEYTLVSENNFLGKKQEQYIPYTINEINNGTILFTMKSMSLSEKDRDEIRQYFESSQNIKKELIIDLRNNMGGEIEDSYFLYSLFSKDTFTPEIERKVNSNTVYQSLHNSTNYSETMNLYPDYAESNNWIGFFQNNVTNPDKFIEIKPIKNSFKGDIYVLTNGFTGSAAVKLASFFKYFKRGFILGEEGAGNLYTMNGLDFANIRLGDIGIELNIPLIKTSSGFDKIKDLPETRGVIPDYEVKESIEDIITNNDKILNYCLELIEQNKMKDSILKYSILSMITILIITLIFIIKVKRSKR